MKGYMGCSNTEQTMTAARTLAPDVFWPDYAIGGGEVDRWATTGSGSRYWQGFGNKLTQYPPDAILFQICCHTNLADRIDEDTDIVLLHLHSLTSVPIYVCAINGYIPDDLNSSVAWKECQAEVARVVALGTALQGPIIPSLDASKIKNDTIHLKQAGAMECAKPIVEFFT